MAEQGDPPIGPVLTGEERREDLPSETPSQGDADAVDTTQVSRTSSGRSLFRPPPPSAVWENPPVGGGPRPRLATGIPRPGVGTRFGRRQPGGELSGSPPFLAGGSSHPREPAGGSSSRATPGTFGEIEGSPGFFDGSFESTLAQLVRDEIEQSMRKFTLSTQGASRRISRRGKRAS